MAQSNEDILNGYLQKGGIYLEIYYLLLKLAKPSQGRYRLKLMLDEVFVVASDVCNKVCAQKHPEANFDTIWYEVKNDYKRYETDLIFSVVYTLLKCVPVKGKNFIPVIVEIEEKNRQDGTYFPYFKELAENWLKEQQTPVTATSPSQVEVLLKQIETLQKENESLKLRNADLEEKVKDSEYFGSRYLASRADVEVASRYLPRQKKYTFEDLLGYAKSRQSYANSEQIMTMLSKFLREDGTNEQWEKFDETETYLLNRDGGSINIEKNFGSLTTNEKGGLVLNLSSPQDKQQLIEFLRANNINLIEK